MTNAFSTSLLVPLCLHDERHLRGSLGPYLAIERCLAAELGGGADRTHDTNGVGLRASRLRPSRAPAFAISLWAPIGAMLTRGSFTSPCAIPCPRGRDRR